MHLGPTFWAWVAILWSSLHDLLFVGVYLALKRLGIWQWVQSHVRWLMPQPRRLTVQEMQKELAALHEQLHTLEEQLHTAQS